MCVIHESKASDVVGNMLNDKRCKAANLFFSVSTGTNVGSKGKNARSNEKCLKKTHETHMSLEQIHAGALIKHLMHLQSMPLSQALC